MSEWSAVSAGSVLHALFVGIFVWQWSSSEAPRVVHAFLIHALLGGYFNVRPNLRDMLARHGRLQHFEALKGSQQITVLYASLSARLELRQRRPSSWSST
ncbi:hypothetical protein PF001_g6695 [Phytophthora fragariae]|uniref:Uncharacterized protein n=1 Tax=Phytophthora fragariae TaxID=53985 RepID=A0A6A4EH27_9STRA|nr:hypothetical protein PF001_g6695 [Phytophthora fragariae]